MSGKVRVLGIDLGTTLTAAATLDDEGRPTTIRNAEGDLTTPTVVRIDERSIVVGREALKATLYESGFVAQGVKREMGNAVFSQAIAGEFFPPEVIQSLVLDKVRRDAESRIGPIGGAVITVPAYFNEPRRKATQDAGRLAGLEVLDIINEPTAAALAYGFREGFLTETGTSRRRERILVYDLGGGTFDATLMQIDGPRYDVLATDGDAKLGGLDWDLRLADVIAERFRAKHGDDPRDEPVSRQRLLREAERAKMSLSARDYTTLAFLHGGRAVRFSLTRAEFEVLTAPLVERTRFTVTNLLRQAGSTWSDVTRILLAGGATRMPMVAAMLERESGKRVDRSLSADEAIAQGAAIYAGLLVGATHGQADNVVVTNVNSHSLGVLGIEEQTGRYRNGVLIERNTSLPTARTALFRTYSDDQRSVSVQVIEGGDASGNNATPIARCVVRELPEGLPSGTSVEVTFTYLANGRLSIHARVPSVDREARLDVERAAGLSDTKLDEWGRRMAAWVRPLDLDS